MNDTYKKKEILTPKKYIFLVVRSLFLKMANSRHYTALCRFTYTVHAFQHSIMPSAQKESEKWHFFSLRLEKKSEILWKINRFIII